MDQKGKKEFVVPKELNNNSWDRIIRYNFIYSLFGLVVGILCLFGGIILFLKGVTEKANWTIKILNIESNISETPVGLGLFIVGLIIIFITRFVTKIK